MIEDIVPCGPPAHPIGVMLPEPCIASTCRVATTGTQARLTAFEVRHDIVSFRWVYYVMAVSCVFGARYGV